MQTEHGFKREDVGVASFFSVSGFASSNFQRSSKDSWGHSDVRRRCVEAERHRPQLDFSSKVAANEKGA